MKAPPDGDPAASGAAPPQSQERSQVRSDGTAPRVTEVAAWALAVLPLAATALYAAAGALGVDLGVVSVAALAAAAVLVVHDKRWLAAAGTVPRSALPSTWWFLFPPCYLARRARLLGAPRTQFHASLACLALALVARAAIAAVFASRVAGPSPAPPRVADIAPELPPCDDEDALDDVIAVFGDLGPMREAGIRGVAVSDRKELRIEQTEGPPMRYCTGSMLASDSQDYDIYYGYETVGRKVIVHVKLK